MKNVLVLIHDDDGQKARLQGALDAVRALEGHLTFIHVTELAPIIGADAYGMSGGVMMLEAEQQIEQENRVRIDKQLAVEGVPYDWVEITGGIEPAMKDSVGMADLVVVNSQRAQLFQRQVYKLVETLVVKSGKPLLAVPTEDGFRPADPVLVAWDGSDPATAALRAAIPLLRMSESVTVYEVDDGSNRKSAEEAAKYLSRYGIKPDVIRDRVPDRDFVQPMLLSKLESGHYGWAVMGAFSRSRLREALFGGTTKAMLKEAPVPLLIAH